jgi:pimeloyl-ACP methyl ester carboxylesterase
MELDVAGEQVYAYTGARAFDAALPGVVFVHGAANDHSVYSLQSRYFAHHGRNVLALDLPAHGRSSGTPLASVEAAAQWVQGVLDAAGVAKTALVGHSFGALISLELAAALGDRVTHLAMLGVAVPMRVSDELMDTAARDDHAAFDMINGWSFSPGKKLGGNTLPGVWLTGNSLRLMERTRRGVLHTDLGACRRYEGGLAAATKVRCPALVVLGARDVMTPPKGADKLVAALPNCRRVEIADAGHSMMAEEPDAVLDALIGFL